MIWALIRLWRRTRCCRTGEHRWTVETIGGSVLQFRCIDCHTADPQGWVKRGTNKLHTLFPWERDDA